MKYKLFGKSGLRVSEICLGAMTFGEEWGTGADKEESKKIFDYFVNQGGNFIDTANRYTEGTSERFLGEFIAHDRDRFVIASKYTLYDKRDDINASGNHRKNMMRSVENSLKRLNTSYLDLLWVHMWDETTPVEEMMKGLEDLVSSGKVHYIGVSDTPAWVVSKANTLSELRGWAAFVGLQIEYSLIQRTPERDLIPMAHHFGMAITPWSPLGAGMLTGKYNESIPSNGVRLSEKSLKINEHNRSIAKEVSSIAQELGVTPAQVALNWLRQQHSQIIPIVGSRKVTQIKDSLACLDFVIPNEQLQRLNKISAIELGFPHDFLNQPAVRVNVFGDNEKNLIYHRNS
ncbi:MAG: aldo/keto reductase [Thermoflexibacter sp.]|jgi:aryl-alcohol dehydrogenase-like predicted oxidoreductase|nr:aldo/keto reductase [Thermoflexibacter sp.]